MREGLAPTLLLWPSLPPGHHQAVCDLLVPRDDLEPLEGVGGGAADEQLLVEDRQDLRLVVVLPPLAADGVDAHLGQRRVELDALDGVEGGAAINLGLDLGDRGCSNHPRDEVVDE